jgi:hypothetical protein
VHARRLVTTPRRRNEQKLLLTKFNFWNENKGKTKFCTVENFYVYGSFLANEYLLAKGVLSQSNQEDDSVTNAYRRLLPLKSAFPTLTKLFQIALTIVVSTAQCERSFSALTRIKTHLRTTMTNERLANTSLLSLERELTTSATFLEDTIRDLEGHDNNRTTVLS